MRVRLLAVALAVALVCRPGGAAVAPEAVDWRIDNLDRIGGHPVTVIGSPRVVSIAGGTAIEFNGRTDGLFLDVNPLSGLARFTVEVLFEPAIDGPEEQRFVHFESAGDTGARALIELRLFPGALWCLDTYLRWNSVGLTLLDRAASHAAGQWHAAALTYDGKTMAHYVDGVRERSGDVAFKIGAGRTSIGVRRNKVSWFKGRIRMIRITPEALAPDRFIPRPAR